MTSLWFKINSEIHVKFACENDRSCLDVRHNLEFMWKDTSWLNFGWYLWIKKYKEIQNYDKLFWLQKVTRRQGWSNEKKHYFFV